VSLVAEERARRGGPNDSDDRAGKTIHYCPCDRDRKWDRLMIGVVIQNGNCVDTVYE
jgi:hypothetical protein